MSIIRRLRHLPIVEPLTAVPLLFFEECFDKSSESMSDSEAGNGLYGSTRGRKVFEDVDLLEGAESDGSSVMYPPTRLSHCVLASDVCALSVEPRSSAQWDSEGSGFDEEKKKGLPGA